MSAVGPRLPAIASGLRVGLFGGSFDPPHEGHRLVSLLALRRLGLDRVWWLVTPGNPLKRHDGLAALDARIAAAQALAGDPRIVVTGIEAAIGTRYTYDTIAWLRRRCPGVRFVWIMGADNLGQFHRWQRWREIAALAPIAVVDRPGSTLRAAASPAARALAPWRIPETEARSLVATPPPAWCFLHGPRSAASSTRLRQQRNSPVAL